MRKRLTILIIFTVFIMTSCVGNQKEYNPRPKVLVSTAAIADVVNYIGGEFVETETIIANNADPHAYRTSENDVIRLSSSDMIIYNGFSMEGRLEYALKKIKASIPTITLLSAVPKEMLIESKETSGQYNTHFWLDVSLWIGSVSYISDSLSMINPRNEPIYRRNEETFIVYLRELDNYIKKQVDKIPENRRILVTNHDAFDYFGRAYGFTTASLKGINNNEDVSSSDIEKLCNFIIENKVKVIFGERNTPERNLMTLQSALENKNYKVRIGGRLYADTLGKQNSPIRTYISMMTYNIDVITNALKDTK